MLLVTGITGHTGRYFLQELIDQNYKGLIRCVVRKNSDTSLIDASGLNIEKVIGDLNNPFFIDNIMENIEVVMHIYNIHHSPQIVRSAMKYQVKRAILVHTTGIYSQFKKASQDYKLIEEDITRLLEKPEYPTAVTILRPSMIYGDLCDSNMSKFIKMIDKNRIMPVIDGGRSLIQPVNARDLGKAYYQVLIHPKETVNKNYNLSGENPVEIIAVLKQISDELNKRRVFISIPLSMSILASQILHFLSMGKINLIEKVQRMGENRSYSHLKATEDFGYQPNSFKIGLHNEVQEYKQSLKENKKYKT